MTDNVVNFPGKPIRMQQQSDEDSVFIGHKVEADICLSSLLGKMKTVAIVGYDHNGNEIFSTTEDRKDSLIWLLERGKHMLLTQNFVVEDEFDETPETPEHETSPQVWARAAYSVLLDTVEKYGKQGGPWNVPSDPGSWIERAKQMLRIAPESVK